MNDVATTFPRFERSGFALMAMVTGAVLFLAGVAPRTERALFFQQGDRGSAKAFSAVVPPLDLSRSQVERSLLSNGFGSRSSRSGEGLTNRGPTRVLASNGLSNPGVLGQPFLPAGSGQPEGVGPGNDLLPPAPGTQGSTPGDTGPSGTVPSVPSTTPGTPALPGPIPGAPATPPVAAVPEPASWIMMLFGFLIIGGAVRRRPTTSGARKTCSA